MDNEEILKIFKDKMAVMEGHFLLTSGLHSRIYIQCARVLQDPVLVDRLAKEAASQFQDENINYVLSPAVGGIIWGYALASRLGCNHIFAEREKEKLTLRRGFEIFHNQRILLAEDVITTGGSVDELNKICQKAKAKVIGLASMVDRSGGYDLGVKTVSLLNIEVESYMPEKCPFCRQGISFFKPGSRKFINN